MPYMPRFEGVVETGHIHRFMSIHEQVLTVIGEAKHGLWRTQDTGMVRLHRLSKTNGVKVGADLNDPSLLGDIQNYYASFLSTTKWLSGYDPYDPSYPDGGSSAKFLDLPITHVSSS